MSWTTYNAPTDDGQNRHGQMYPARPLRSHSSVSSLASNTSLVSDYSQQGWSSVASERSSETEPDTLAHRRVSPPAHSAPPAAAGLSIDPKLFQAKAGLEDRLATARPRVGKVPKTPKSSTEVAPGPTHGEAAGKGAKGAKDKKKVSHARKQHPEHIPRPRNAFILFRKHVVDSKLIPPSVEMRHQNVSVIVAKMWSEAGPEQKAHFNELAKIEKEEHMKKYPGYRYQPVYRRTNVIRRRVRKDDAEEEKWRSVAELLIKGKSGQALEQEIRNKIQRNNAGPASNHNGAVGANELSKGALRAMRAQSRQTSTPSVDWTECSSRASLAPSREASPVALESDFAYDLHGADGDVPMDMPYAHMGSLGFEWPQQPVQQTYAYPDESAPMMYPQPVMALPAAGFYTYDQALPFSPTAGSFSAQMDPQVPHVTLPQDQPVMQAQQHLFAAPYPSPTGGFFSNADGGNGMIRLQPPPVSARWDQTHLLPPSSELGLDGLGFEGDDFLLQDFGAALAQATQYDESVW